MKANKGLTCYTFNSAFQVCIQEPKKIKIVHWGVKMGGKVENYKFPHIIIRIRNYGANVV